MHVLLAILFLYYMILFSAGRLAFLSYNYQLTRDVGSFSANFGMALVKGLPLDIAMASYLLVIPWVVLMFDTTFRRKSVRLVIKWYIIASTILLTVISSADTLVYPEWKIKLNARALSVFQHPLELWQMTRPPQMLAGFFLVFCMSLAGSWLCLRVMDLLCNRKQSFSRTKPQILAFAWPFLLGFAARGGAGPIALDISRVYYSQDSTLNDGATNSAYYFTRSVMQSRSFLFGKNPYTFYPDAEAKRIVESLGSSKQNVSTPKILTGARPNIVFIILESWSADLVGSLGGLPGITPEFDELAKNGVLFRRFFANGNRSQQGIASIFAGFPALPHATVTENPGKARHLPAFASLMKTHGYASFFMYGGSLEYGNIKAFLISNGFGRLIEGKDFDPSLSQANLGIHDGMMFDLFAQHLDGQTSSPFMGAMFTLNTHMPYDIPHPERYTFRGNEADYVKSVMYADEQLGRFFRTVRDAPWFSNTLFVIVADHSHQSPIPRNNWEPAYRKIPMLLYGDVIKTQYRGQPIDKTGSQVDIIATLAGQLDIDATLFPWSKNMLAKGKGFACYEANSNIGWLTDRGDLVLHIENKVAVLSSSLRERVPQEAANAAAYVQLLFRSFIDL